MEHKRPEKPRRREPKYYLIVVFVILATLIGYIVLIHPDLKNEEVSGCPLTNMAPSEYGVKLNPDNKLAFDVEFAKTSTQQELGLSHRPCMPKNAALLFLFAKDDRFGIWMKEMRFPIDVVWLDKDKKIVTIEKNMRPDSYPKIYYPSADARYAIEFNTGTVDSLKVGVGSTLSW